MSIPELKKMVEETSREERVFLAAYLRHLQRGEQEGHRDRLDQLCDEFSSGRRYSIGLASNLHDKLEEGDR